MADETILIEIDYESNADETEKEIDDLTSSIEGLTIAQSQLKDQVEKGQISDVEASKQKAKLQTQLQTEKKQRKDLIKITQAETGSRDKMRLGINKLIKERDGLNTKTVEGARRSEELRKKIDKLTAAQKKSGVQVQAQTANIGNYTKQAKKSSKQTNKLKVTTNNFSSSMSSIPGPISTVITGMKTLAKVIFATPLGWLIGLIAGAGAALKTFFTGSAEGQERWNKTMNKAKAVMSVFKDELIKVGKGISDFTKNIKESEGGIKGWAKNLKDKAQAGFKKFGEDVKDKGLWNTLKDNTNQAIDAVKNKLDELDASLQENLRRAEIIAAKQNELRRDEIDSLTDVAMLNRDIAQLRAKAADRENTTAQQRLDLLDAAINKQNEILAIEEGLAAERVKIQKLEMAQGENRLEDYEKLAELEKAQIDLETINAERRRRFQSERQTAINQIAAERTAALAAEQAIIDEEIAAELIRIDESLNIEKAAIDKSVENWQEGEEAKTEATEEQSNKRRDTIKASLDAIGQITGQATSFLIDQNNARLTAELTAAGDNEQQKAAIEKKFAKKQRKLMLTQAIAKGALVILNALTTVPFPAGLIAAGAAAVATGFQIATIRNAKFNKGGQMPLAKRGIKAGTFSGPSHVSGGIPIVNGLTGQPIAEVEGKENFYVVNKQASSYINSLSDINQRIGGGVPLSNTRKTMQDGGQADVNGSQPGININDITERVVANLPPIVVQTVDIKTGLEDRNDVLNVGVV